MKKYVEITPERGRFRLGFRELWDYRDLVILLTNFANAEVQAFLTALLVIGLLWSGFILIVGMYYIHQFTFGSLLLNLLLTLISIAIILFLLLLGYSLIQQIITFVVTLYNEIVFRL